MESQNRIEPLDWLRGLMALGIMFYHLSGWLFFELDSSTLLGRLGVYGVSIFFVLSGLSMAIVYNHISDFKTSAIFLIRRIFRIWPLLWIVCILTVIPNIVLNHYRYSVELLILNFTTLFGFIKPQAYIATGSWSIGNEMVYYVLTPIIIFLYNRRLRYGNLFYTLTILIGFIFSQFLLSPLKSLADQWPIYINPFNNLFFYTSGIALFYNFRFKKISRKMNNMVFSLCLILFIFVPFAGNQINIVTGLGRIVLSLISIAIVLTFYKTDVSFSKHIAFSLKTFGITTYSVYLLHPVVHLYINGFLHKVLTQLSHPGCANKALI